MTRLAVLTLGLLGSLAGTAAADLRSFTHTYEYSTVPQGKTALELWHTQGRATWDKSSPQFFEQILEIEHGITDHWDVAFYQVFAQTSADAATPGLASPYHFAETALETRYRFADRGEWPVDTLIYAELSKEFGESVYGLEGKVIVARDFDKLTAAANAIVELKVGNDAAETEPEIGFAAGATYQVHPTLRLGAETWGAVEEGKAYLSAGPAVSWAPASDFWLAMTAGFGIREAEKFSARVIIGLEL